MKKRGKGLKVTMSRLTYDNPKVNKQVLKMKKTIDEVNAALEGLKKKKK